MAVFHGTDGLDAVVGSVGNGSMLRLISDIPGVKYTDSGSFELHLDANEIKWYEI